MRLSVNLDPPLYESLRAMAYAERSTLSAVLNRVVRNGLEGTTSAHNTPASLSSRFPVSTGQAGLLLTSTLVANLEDEAERPAPWMLNEQARP